MSDDDSSKREKAAIAASRKHRPGMHSYLKIMFQNDDILNRLHSTTVDLQKELSRQTSESAEHQHQATEMDSSFHTTNDSPMMIPKFRTRSLNSLHMTLFFGGETLCNGLSRQDISSWYHRIQDRLAQSGFRCLSSPYTELQQQQTADEFWFQFVRLRTFPPGRNYLIVAEFEASPAWHTLYYDLLSIASDFEGLDEIAKSNKKRWVPHITLANMIHSRARNEWLDVASESLVSKKKIIASGVSIGGPVPLKEELDWNFVYHGSSQ